MDVKVKQMIKLIEEDADSFARRAEMYYEKRPELMKLVEEFYRAYRALAERYDHATGVLRQAHRTMAEAFPNQVPLMLTDDSPIGSADSEPCTPDMPPIRALFDSDELQKDALGISTSHSPAVKKHGAFTEESDSVPGRRGLKQLNDLFGTGEGRARKGLSFHDAEEKYQGVQDDGKNDIKAQVPSDSELLSKAEQEIVTLKNILAKLEAEKEAGLLEYQQSLQRLSNLESEVSCAKEDSSKAEAEVQTLKEALTKLEAEREASLLQYQHCLDKIAYLENNISNAQKDAKELNERSCKADKLEAEKEDILLQYKQCLEKITCLEGKILHAEEDARRFNECADKAEMEVESLKEVLAKLTEEKEAAAVQYQQCLDTISSLEQKLAFVQEEAQRLKSELADGVVKLKGAEEKCLQLERSNQTMHSELESLAQKMSAQSDELTEKQEELGRLWTCIQEERLRFVEAETAFQTLQHLHSQSQEELRSMAAELQNRAEILQDLEVCNQSLQNEVEKVKIENKGLSEVNSSSTLTIQNLQDEISNLRQTIGKLEAEVELRLDQRNALQQEIYCLKEELKGINKKNQAIMDQVDSVGFSPECLGSSVKGLQDENIKLKEERATLAQLSESQLAGMATRIRMLQEEGQCIKKEHEEELDKAFYAQTEIFILQKCVQDLEEHKFSHFLECQKFLEASKLSEKLISELELENLEQQVEMKSLYDKIDVLRVGLYRVLKTLELDVKQGCEDKAEQDQMLLSHALDKLQETQRFLFEMQDQNQQLVVENTVLVTLLGQLQREVANLMTAKSSLDQELACRSEQFFILHGESQKLAEVNEELRSKIIDGDHKEESLKVELKTLHGQLLDLQGDYQNLQKENCKIVDEQRLLMKSISNLREEKCNLEDENCAIFAETVSLSTISLIFRDIISEKFLGMKELCENLDKLHHVNNGLNEKVKIMEGKLLELSAVKDEKRELHKMVEELKCKYDEVELIRADLDKELACRSEQFFILHGESQKLAEVNEELRSKIIDGDHKEESLKVELKTLHGQLLDLQGDYQNLQKENCKMVDEQRLLMKSISNLREEKCNLEDENCAIFAETVSLSTISLIFRDIISEKFLGMKELCENLDKLHHVNNGLNEKVKIMEGKLLELSAVKDEKRELHKMVEELKCKYDEVELIRADLDQELASRSEQLLVLHGEGQKLAEVNEELRSKIIEGDHKEESLKVELKTLHGQLLDLQGDYQNLQKENCKMELCENLDKLHHVNIGLNEKVKIMEGKLLELSAVKDEKRELHKMVEELKCKYDEVELIRADLGQELASRSEQFLVLHGESQKLAEVNEELRSKIIEGDHKEESLKVELKTLHGQLLDLQGDYQNLQKENCKMVDEQRWLMKSITNLGEDKCNLEDENCAIFAETVSLSTISLIFRDIISEKLLEMKELSENLDELHHVNNGLNEKVKIMEGVLLELSAVKDKKRELHKMVEDLKCKYDEIELIRADQEKQIIKLSGDCYEQTKEVECIQEANRKLETELGKLNGELLENKIREESLNCELQKRRNEVEWWESQAAALFGELQNLLSNKHCMKERFMSSLKHDAPFAVDAESCQQISDDQISVGPGGLLDLQGLQMRIIAIEEAVKERERLVILENSNANSKLADAIRQIEELKSISNSNEEAIESSKHRNQNPEDKELGSEAYGNLGLQKPIHETSEEGTEVMTKDIMLDQTSECSSYGISRRETGEADNQMLEICESTDRNDSIDLTVGKAQKETAASTENKEDPSMESMVEKHVSVDKLEISKRLSGSRQEVNERKILERLDSDAQKLTNLQITVQDMKRKVEITEKNKKGKGIEYDSVKGQLEESEEAITKLFDVNRKLMKSIEDEPLSIDEKSALASDENGSVRKRRISEQARRGSEKIGRLQLEVQKLQFLLLKLDDENKSRGKTKIVERNTGVRLRDYLYGGTRTSQKREKGHFCACMQPPTKGD
ncbi:hypothetical protein GH714_036888 [Hevea brasiliensis]|uniref:NAB domain-containing protein n=1 Tax=Hevea brasiliensis TaxID=3981 RepID=A0A6A6MQJ7_HEVBR|nr:hypothetical protein GH714_036888 [Hevea brasiliensis]